ncbi:hypothetical protein GCM10009865_33510 [Aeromicrobium ponti]
MTVQEKHNLNKFLFPTMTTPPIYFSAGCNFSPWKEYLYIFMHKPPCLKPDRVFPSNFLGKGCVKD